MNLADRIINLVAPYDCLRCGQEGNLICQNCLGGLLPAVARCYRCQQLSPGFTTCGICRRQTPIHSVRARQRYHSAAKQLLWKLKFDGAQAVVDMLATGMTSGLRFPEAAVWMAVPTATGRIRRRGYDQAELLARALARQTGLPHVRGLARAGQSEQIGAGREQRLRQLGRAFRVTKPQQVRGRHIILVDDVITTGATLETAALALAVAGAARIDAMVYAQA